MLNNLVDIYGTCVKPHNTPGRRPDEETELKALNPALKVLKTWGNKKI